MPQLNDLSRSLVALDQDSTIITVVEMSQSSWLVAGMLPGIERQPCKKLEPSPERLLALLHRWRDEGVRAGRTITRIAVAFEAGRDGFWLARWLAARGVEAHVIHASSLAVSREHRRAKTERLDTALLKRGFLGWLRGERGHCSMARVPTIAEEDAKRPNRERDCLVGEPRVGELESWDDVKLLSVTVDRLRKWWRPGLICIGDAAHATSPIGGVGINMAVQDAVAAGNRPASALRSSKFTDDGP